MASEAKSDIVEQQLQSTPEANFIHGDVSTPPVSADVSNTDQQNANVESEAAQNGDDANKSQQIETEGNADVANETVSELKEAEATETKIICADSNVSQQPSDNSKVVPESVPEAVPTAEDASVHSAQQVNTEAVNTDQQNANVESEAAQNGDDVNKSQQIETEDNADVNNKMKGEVAHESATTTEDASVHSAQQVSTEAVNTDQQNANMEYNDTQDPIKVADVETAINLCDSGKEVIMYTWTEPHAGYYFVDDDNDIYHYYNKNGKYYCFNNNTKIFKECKRPYEGKFDSDRWLAEFKEAARTRSYYSLHNSRIEIIKDTFEKLDYGWYTSCNGKKVKFEKGVHDTYTNTRSVEHHIFQDGFPKLPPMSERPYKVTEVFVRDADCVVEAIKMLDEGMKAAVINMANAYSPGGGYLHGAGAQEENLFRRSNCNDFLDPERRNSNSNLYPIPECGGNYVPGVTVFRGKESDGYPLLDVPKKLDVLTVAALAHPSVHIDQATGRYVMSEEETKITYNKIRVLYEMARIHKNDGIVLSAIGCGAFRNPPWQVAELFLKATKKYYGFFKRIVFAIFDDHNARKETNPDGNFLPFKEVFEKFEFAHYNPDAGEKSSGEGDDDDSEKEEGKGTDKAQPPDAKTREDKPEDSSIEASKQSKHKKGRSSERKKRRKSKRASKVMQVEYIRKVDEEEEGEREKYEKDEKREKKVEGDETAARYEGKDIIGKPKTDKKWGHQEESHGKRKRKKNKRKGTLSGEASEQETENQIGHSKNRRKPKHKSKHDDSKEEGKCKELVEHTMDAEKSENVDDEVKHRKHKKGSVEKRSIEENTNEQEVGNVEKGDSSKSETETSTEKHKESRSHDDSEIAPKEEEEDEEKEHEADDMDIKESSSKKRKESDSNDSSTAQSSE